MKAVQLAEYGAADQLRYATDAPMPLPAPNQVLIRVEAAGVSPLDLRLRRGDLRWLLHTELPLILGNEVAGEVVAVGGAEARFRPGDRVFGLLDSFAEPAWLGIAGPGAYAEYAISCADTLIPLPAGLLATAAAALPLAGLTAWQALYRHAQLRAGDAVFIHGGASDAGLFALQLAHVTGAEITASCSPGQAGRVRDFGAHHVVDYHDQVLTGEGPSYALIYDVAGTLDYDAIQHRLHPDGVFVSDLPTTLSLLRERLFAPVAQRLGFHRRQHHVWVRPDTDALGSLLQLWQQHRLHIPLSRVFALREAADAHRFLESPERWGKVVLSVP